MSQIEDKNLATISIKMLEMKFLGVDFKTITEDEIYFSVPEKVDTDNDHYTSDESINLVKTEMVKTLKDIAKTEDNELLRKFLGETEEEYYNSIVDINFFAKVRTGEIWTQEDQDKLEKELKEKIKSSKQYKPC